VAAWMAETDNKKKRKEKSKVNNNFCFWGNFNLTLINFNHTTFRFGAKILSS